MPLQITHYTDPVCPFAFSAEPVRQRLRWHYGDQLVWRTRLVVLTLEPGEAERLAEGAPGLSRRYGMPIDPAPYARPVSSEPACLAVVAARLNSPALEEPLLRRLGVRTMLLGLLDDPALIAAAARDVGLDPVELAFWAESDETKRELARDIEAARNPLPAARALDHKLGGPRSQRRYTTPSYEISRLEPGSRPPVVVPGFHSVETYEAAIANLAPELVRRPRPERAEDVLAWAEEPLATAEVALLMQLDPVDTRAALSRVAVPTAAGADFYWALAAEPGSN